jgi:D-3-phosphoglycerate dehydrogenase
VAALASLVEDADYVITQFASIDAGIIARMKHCKVIVRYGIGVDNVDLKAAAAKGIPVCNIPDFCTDEVADHTLAMILDLCRRITQNALKVRGGGWGLALPLSEMRSLKDQTVGLIAYGKIGREVALRLRPFKCRILAFDPAADTAKMRADGVEPASLDEIYARSDIVSLHCPSTDATRWMINASSLAKMKKGAFLVNISRGTLVRTDNLVAALRSGHIAAAAMDVTDPEPINPDNPIVAMENVLITSHIASASPQAVLKLRNDAAGIVAGLIKGEKARNIVNGVVA